MLDLYRPVRIVAPVNERTVDTLWSTADSGGRQFRTAFSRLIAAFHLDPILQLAGIVATLAVATLLPERSPAVPDRVVHLPGAGWVDAANVPGLPTQTPDGAVLRYTWSGHSGSASSPADSSATLFAGIDGVNSQLTVFDEVGAAAVDGQVALGGKVSLNRASANSLEGLPGVGPALAARIVAGRPYRSIADLDRVKGIGPKTVAKLAPLIEP